MYTASDSDQRSKQAIVPLTLPHAQDSVWDMIHLLPRRTKYSRLLVGLHTVAWPAGVYDKPMSHPHGCHGTAAGAESESCQSLVCYHKPQYALQI